MIPTIVMLVTYATYTLAMKQELTGALVNAVIKSLLQRTYIYSFQDILQYSSVYFVEEAARTFII